MIRCLAVRKIAFVILVAFAVSVAGCQSCQKKESERLRVVVSIFPIYDLVRRVAGPDADVTLLLQPGHNEHHFDPTPKDVELAAQAKLGVMVGLGLDPWMEKLLHDAAPSARILKVGDRVPTLTIKDDPIGADDHDEDGHHEEEHEHEEKGAPDPHVWLDPQRAQLIVRAVAEELGKVDAPHTLAYRQRATELDRSLVEVDREAEERLKKLTRRGFVTFHGSFGYFAERYKLNILAVIEPFPGSQPTGEYVTKVLAAIKEKQVPALYSEPQLDARPAKVLADEAKIPLGVLDPVGGGKETDSYEKIIRFDVAALEQYLK